MGWDSMLLTEPSRVDEVFFQIVEGLDAPFVAVEPPVAKMRPASDDDGGDSRQEEMEPWEDEDDLPGVDIELP
ncbi:hypothetical protein O4J56_01735 [Nocardiopsis sp. RSe5-2]|uniref:Uncharacterized protein n=1 Tax=Nocardiopsis endophytica TaxID=3018445 RepID=A0ABT4TY51_9ACTN|nr:hypothetical protein [Nocardiopsis endophytica]MDA2809346.1 hypothetical protein [Nocardiopsis endophytica]